MKDQKFMENSNDMDYSMDPHEFVKARTEGGSSVGIINSTSLQQTSSSLERLNFDEGMQLADFGQRFGLNQLRNNEEHSSIDPTFFPQFPIITPSISMPIPIENDVERFDVRNTNSKLTLIEVENEDCGVADNNSLKRNNIEIKGKRKRPRSLKTTEEVENQRMTHIAVERNRRKQMNEHLKVLRSLMPCSYVQRGDQASIIGGAIEFVRELEQLLQCLESQKRRRFLEEAPRPYDNSFPLSLLQFQTPFLPSSSLPDDNIRLFDCDNSFQEEFAEKRSPLADIEVKLVGFEATIKILSQRKHGQLLKTIAALEDLQFDILHLNITTIDQTVLYSFNIKLSHESRFRAEEIANSVQQIFNYIHIRITGGKLGKPLWKRTIYVGSLHV